LLQPATGRQSAPTEELPAGSTSNAGFSWNHFNRVTEHRMRPLTNSISAEANLPAAAGGERIRGFVASDCPLLREGIRCAIEVASTNSWLQAIEQLVGEQSCAFVQDLLLAWERL